MENCNFSLEKVKLIIDEIELNLKQNVGPVVNLINEDNSNFAEKTTLAKLLTAIEQVKSEEWILKKSSKKYVVQPVGNIGVVYDGNPYIFFYLCLKAIKTNNNITFFETREAHKIAKYIIDLVQKLTRNGGCKISINTITKIRDTSKFDESIDKLICIGNSKTYTELRNYIDKEIIYSAYGTMSLYMDDKTLKDKLLEIDDYVFQNNISLELYTDESIDSVIDKINNCEEDFCSVIFTKDIDKASQFINKINSRMVFVNKNPFDEYKLKIDDCDLVKTKKIFI